MIRPGIRDDGRYDEVVERIRAVEPRNERRWGAMRHDQLLPHLADPIRLCLHGDPGPAAGPLRLPPLRYLALHVLPWPRGRIQAPSAAFQQPATTWEQDRVTLLELLDEYMAAPADSIAGKIHPRFGGMSARDWDVLIYRHTDHHLTQFSA